MPRFTVFLDLPGFIPSPRVPLNLAFTVIMYNIKVFAVEDK